MSAALPNARELFDGTTSAVEQSERGGLGGRKFDKSAREIAEAREEFVQEMTKATVAGLTGATQFGVGEPDQRHFPIMPVKHDPSRSNLVQKGLEDYEMAKSAEPAHGAWDRLSKEWTLTNPVGTGLVPYDLEAPAKLLTPRPTPLRNSIPRIKGQGGARRFKVISGFTGTGTGGATTVQPGINETSTNSGPGGLSYVRGPYINYDGYDVTLNYVTTSLSDSVSWQAQLGSAA